MRKSTCERATARNTHIYTENTKRGGKGEKEREIGRERERKEKKKRKKSLNKMSEHEHEKRLKVSRHSWTVSLIPLMLFQILCVHKVESTSWLLHSRPMGKDSLVLFPLPG